MAQATSNTEGLTDQASAKAQEAVDAAQDKAAELRHEGSLQLRDQLDRRSNEAGSQVRSVAQALRRSGDELRTEGNSTAAQWTGQAADKLEQLGSYLEQARGDDLMREIEGFARRRPWMLAGIGMLAGIAAARFMKASSENRYDGGSYRRPALGSGYSGPAPAVPTQYVE
jgi:hypothetical protein